MGIALVAGMTLNKRSIRIEMANGDSFQKRVNAICRYHAGLKDVSDKDLARHVFESVSRAIVNAEIYVTNQ